MTEPTCKDRIKEYMERRTSAIAEIFDWQREEHSDDEMDNGHPDHGPLSEYGLSFDFCVTGDGNETGYFCFLISWGGPSEEIRFLTLSPNTKPEKVRVQFVFSDWNDQAKIDYDETNGRETMEMLWADLQELGVTHAAWEREMESIKEESGF